MVLVASDWTQQGSSARIAGCTSTTKPFKMDLEFGGIVLVASFQKLDAAEKPVQETRLHLNNGKNVARTTRHVEKDGQWKVLSKDAHSVLLAKNIMLLDKKRGEVCCGSPGEAEDDQRFPLLDRQRPSSPLPELELADRRADA